jgi:hypothetical protein
VTKSQASIKLFQEEISKLVRHLRCYPGMQMSVVIIDLLSTCCISILTNDNLQNLGSNI